MKLKSASLSKASLKDLITPLNLNNHTHQSVSKHHRKTQSYIHQGVFHSYNRMGMLSDNENIQGQQQQTATKHKSSYFKDLQNKPKNIFDLEGRKSSAPDFKQLKHSKTTKQLPNIKNKVDRKNTQFSSLFKTKPFDGSDNSSLRDESSPKRSQFGIAHNQSVSPKNKKTFFQEKNSSQFGEIERGLMDDPHKLKQIRQFLKQNNNRIANPTILALQKIVEKFPESEENKKPKNLFRQKQQHKFKRKRHRYKPGIPKSKIKRKDVRYNLSDAQKFQQKAQKAHQIYLNQPLNKPRIPSYSYSFDRRMKLFENFDLIQYDTRLLESIKIKKNNF